MLDIRYIRENADLVQSKSEQKGYKVDVKHLLELDEQRRMFMNDIEMIRAERNKLADDAKGQKPSDEQAEQGKHLKQHLNDCEAKLKPVDEEYQKLLNEIPNPAFDEVPVGGEDASVEITKWGEQTTGAVDHLDFAEKRGWVDFERGAKVAGAKFYFLKNDLARLELALTQFGLNFLLAKGFTYMTVPHMVYYSHSRWRRICQQGK